MAKKQINPERLTDAERDFNAAAARLEEQIPRLEAFVAELDDAWESEASGVYLAKIRAEIVKLKKTRAVLAELGKYAANTRETFKRVDEAVRGSRISELLNSFIKGKK